MTVRDRRKAKFVWASVEALDHIRASWDRKRADCSAKSGLDVYHALTEVANDGKAREAIGAEESNPFKGSQSTIAKRAMVSEKTVARACAELERIGLLLIEVDSEEGKRPGRPSIYVLVEPDQTSDRSSDVGGNQRRTGVQTSSDTSSDVPPKGRTGVRTSLYRKKKNKEEEESAREEQVLPSESAEAAWAAATSLLAGAMNAERFSRYVEPLQVVGIQASAIVLLDTADHGGAGWVEEILKPLALETVDGFAGIVVVDQFELDNLTVLTEFDVWLADYHQVTGRTAVTGSEEARASFDARRKEGRSLEELKLATRGCHGNDYLRREALDRPETILRKKNHARYIELGRSAGRSTADPALASITGREA